MNEPRDVALLGEVSVTVRTSPQRVFALGRREQHDLPEQTFGRRLRGGDPTKIKPVGHCLQLGPVDHAESFGVVTSVEEHKATLSAQAC